MTQSKLQAGFVKFRHEVRVALVIRFLGVRPDPGVVTPVSSTTTGGHLKLYILSIPPNGDKFSADIGNGHLRWR